MKHLFFLILLLNLPILAGSQPASHTDRVLNHLLKKAGRHYYAKENELSLKSCQLLIKKAEASKNHRVLAEAYDVIALNFNDFAEFDKSYHYYQLAIKEANLAKNDTIKTWIYSNLANLLTSKFNRFSEGIKQYNMALKFAKQIDDQVEVSYITLNLAEAYLENGQYEISKKYIQKLFEKRFDQQDAEAQFTLNYLMGVYEKHHHKYKESIQWFSKAEACFKGCKTNLYIENVSRMYLFQSQVLDQLGRHQAAYSKLKSHLGYLKKNFNETASRKSRYLGYQIELNQFQKELQKAQLLKKSQDRELASNRIILVLSIITTVSIGVILLVFVRVARYRSQKNKKLIALNKELLLAKEKSEEANSLKSQFISTITHELRTPLYGITGITDILIEEHPELNRNSSVQSLRFSSRYLLALVNDLLHINKIEENKLELKKVAFNLRDEIENMMNSLHHMAEKNKNELLLVCGDQVPTYIESDLIRLSQILINLLSNGLKFTENGRVTLLISLIDKTNDTARLSFEVTDTGIGIAPENQDKIFEKFIQIERKSEDYQGTGLGLSIVKKLLNLFNSQIQVKSEEGNGTTFSFEIDFKLPKENQIALQSAFVNSLDLSTSHLKVLVVDDNPINQLVTKKILEKCHVQVVIVSDGWQALKEVKKDTFDLILMDINMPGMNGFETTRLLRSEGIHCPIIALTAFDKNEKWPEVIESGMNDILVKPFEATHLVEVITKNLQ
ncbi:MAG: hybrid sensor histidine kinase/response regulator [Flavobacterium sp. BFFFF2]|nr:MAG: hybrid sensor histidine kinase/response regulator [Flavobacterium sp. BFFFF2]